MERREEKEEVRSKGEGVGGERHVVRRERRKGQT